MDKPGAKPAPPEGRWRRLVARRFRSVIGRVLRSRLTLAVPATLVLIGVVAAGLAGPEAGPSSDASTRLDAFRDASPVSLTFLENWWKSGGDEDEDAVALITDEVREEYFRELPFGKIIHDKARKYEVDPALVAAIVEVESAFDDGARSSRGALGLMQLRPATGRWMGADDLLDPSQNIDAGIRYLKYLEETFDGDLDRQLAAYNAGESVVRRYGGIPPYPETVRYIRKVMRRYEQRNRELERFGRDWIEQGRDLEAAN